LNKDRVRRQESAAVEGLQRRFEALTQRKQEAIALVPVARFTNKQIAADFNLRLINAVPRFEDYDDIANHILLSLPLAALNRIRPVLEPINLARGQVLCGIGRPIKYLYFVTRGLVSLVKTMQDGRTVEIGAIGIEGITNPNALIGPDKAILESVVEIPGTAFRIRRDTLVDKIGEDPALFEAIQKYARFAVCQLVETAACNRLHSLEECCCRWLLIAHDSALTDTFPLTHEFLAIMLGVERSSISVTAGLLKKAGLIEYKRGHITITNRSGLEKAACECYGTIRAERQKLFGMPNKRQFNES
jgi:CRP-like cAMP-binding protein